MDQVLDKKLDWETGGQDRKFEGASISCKYKKEDGNIIVQFVVTSCSHAGVAWNKTLTNPTSAQMYKYIKKVFSTFDVSFMNKETGEKLDWKKFSFKSKKAKLTEELQGFEMNDPDVKTLLEGFLKAFDDLGFVPVYDNKVGLVFATFLLVTIFPMLGASGGGA